MIKNCMNFTLSNIKCSNNFRSNLDQNTVRHIHSLQNLKSISGFHLEMNLKMSIGILTKPELFRFIGYLNDSM